MGYSASTFGDTLSVTQCYAVDRDALNEYLVYAPDFECGVIVTVNTTEEAISPVPNSSGVLSAEFDLNLSDYLEIKVTGISKDKADTALVFCLYTVTKDKIYYLDNGVTAESVAGVSHSSIS